jgi:two-component system sensor histidine kinase/response regulator
VLESVPVEVEPHVGNGADPQHAQPRPDASAELERLRVENAQLQHHVGRLSVVQQQLIDTRDRLDRELGRFGGIHRFNALALGIDAAEALAEVAAETIVDLFELEFGAVWPVTAAGSLSPAPSALVEVDAEVLSRALVERLIAQAGFNITGGEKRRHDAQLWTREDEALLAEFGLHKLVICPSCGGAEGGCLALVIGGVMTASADFYAGFDRAQTESFTVFAQQVGALLQNRADRATIEQQISELKASEERLNLAVDGSNVGLWDWDLRTDRVFFSDRWKAQIGFEPHEIASDFSAWIGRLHPDDADRARRRVEDYLAGHLPEYECVHRLLHKDGRYVWILARGRALRDGSGKPYRMVGTHIDVSDQKSIAEKFSTIFEYSGDGYLLIDGRGRIVDSNPVSNRWFDLEGRERSAEELFAMAPKRQADGRESDAAAREWMTAAFNDGFVRFEWLFRDAQAREFPTEVSLVRVTLDERLVLFASLHDLTEQKRTEEALRRSEIEQRKAREQAESANRAKSAFLATTSHEIRTPMNGVLGMLQLLEESSLDEKQASWVEMASQSGRLLLTIIDDILDLSKVEAGRMELDAVPFDPVAVISSSIESFHDRAERKGLELELVFDDRLPARVIGDDGRLRQILTNLIGNAIKFTERGGVRIQVSEAGSASSVCHLHMRIRDSGIGMDGDTLARLFTPFMQADAGTTRRFGGTGLGLAICRRLAELMGGKIEVESELGVGTEFRVELTFPVSEVAHTEPAGLEMPILGDSGDDQPAAETSAAATRSGGVRVLLVEDNPINQAVASAMLRKLGVQLITAVNGREALDRILADSAIDLVFMDVQMPVMDGYEATRRLRALEQAGRRPRLPVVALTANAMTHDRKACAEAGMDDFISKPMTKNSLRAAITRWVEDDASRSDITSG